LNDIDFKYGYPVDHVKSTWPKQISDFKRHNFYSPVTQSIKMIKKDLTNIKFNQTSQKPENLLDQDDLGSKKIYTQQKSLFRFECIGLIKTIKSEDGDDRPDTNTSDNTKLASESFSPLSSRFHNNDFQSKARQIVELSSSEKRIKTTLVTPFSLSPIAFFDGRQTTKCSLINRMMVGRVHQHSSKLKKPHTKIHTSIKFSCSSVQKPQSSIL
jgi:hypothetical protein